MSPIKPEKPDKGSNGGGFGLTDILFPIFLPIKGTIWIADKLKQSAETEVTDESKVREELLDLQMRFEMGEVNEEEYKKKETKILERLEAIRKYKEGRR
ncbi:MAG: gas vesicle protein GvpG [bacterium]